MATNREIDDTIHRVRAWYGGECPVHVLASELKCTVEEAEHIIATNPILKPKPKPVVKRKPRAKKVTPAKVEPKPIEVKPIEQKTITLVHDSAKILLPYGSAIIALIALARSFMFTHSYFLRTDGILSAIFMALLFALVGYLSPSICIMAFKAKRWAVFIMGLFLFILFGWLNTYITIQELDVSKDAKEYVLSAEEEVIIKARNRVADIDKEIEHLSVKIVDNTKERDVVLAMSAKPDIPMWEYNRHRNNLADIKKAIEDAETKKNNLQLEKNNLTLLDGYYTMTITNERDKSNARSMDMVYGIALEIVGPVFLVFALFL